MNTRGQSTIEFTFAVIVIMFLIYGMVQVFHWAGMDLAQRRYSQDASLTVNVPSSNDTYLNGTEEGDPSVQLNSDIDEFMPMAATYHGNITDGNIDVRNIDQR